MFVRISTNVGELFMSLRREEERFILKYWKK